MKRSLYVHRKVVNASQILAWAAGQGFTSALAPEDLHVTIAFSRRPVDWDQIPKSEDANKQIDLDGDEAVGPGPTDDRTVKPLGDKGAVVLTLGTPWRLRWRWEEFCRAGCSWDYPEYHPHITITYKGAPKDLGKVLPYMGPVVLGPEYWDTIDDDWSSDLRESDAMKFAKINEEKRVVYGWASVITKGGQPIVDHQNDVIEADDLQKAAHEFMLGEQEAGLMHAVKTGIGKVVESVVLTKDLQDALGIDLGMEGWFIGVKISDDTTWSAVKKGTLRAFSIGGKGEREVMKGDPDQPRDEDGKWTSGGGGDDDYSESDDRVARAYARNFPKEFRNNMKDYGLSPKDFNSMAQVEAVSRFATSMLGELAAPLTYNSDMSEAAKRALAVQAKKFEERIQATIDADDGDPRARGDIRELKRVVRGLQRIQAGKAPRN